VQDVRKEAALRRNLVFKVHTHKEEFRAHTQGADIGKKDVEATLGAGRLCIQERNHIPHEARLV
jgi:hypothetical protein